MGTYTTNYQLYIPTVGEQGWGTLVNGNFTTIDTTMKGLDTRLTTVENEINGNLSCTSVTTSGTITSMGVINANGGINGKINVNSYGEDANNLKLLTVSIPDVFGYSTSDRTGALILTPDNITVKKHNTSVLDYSKSNEEIMSLITLPSTLSIWVTGGDANTTHGVNMAISITDTTTGDVLYSATVWVRDVENPIPYTYNFNRQLNHTYTIGFNNQYYARHNSKVSTPTTTFYVE